MNTYFYLVIGLILAMFAFELIVSILNYRYKNQPIPENVQGLYDDEKYSKWLSYSMANFKFGLVSNTVSTLLMVLLLALGVFGAIETLMVEMTSSLLLQNLLFLFAYFLITFLIGIPFSYYRIFKIEETFGFNKVTKKLFVSDKIKSLILTIVFGVGSLVYFL